MADSTKAAFSSQKYQFLSGGGEMGQLMRAKDWSATAVGIPDLWPQSLRTSLSIILNARFPMFLWWGPDLTCFYNDAYRPSLGDNGKHPGILGMPAEKAWTEIWHIIKPLIDQVLAGGESSFFEDTLVPIYRNGKIEDVFWTFSYSAVNDESGKPAGVFVTCVETTDKIANAKKIEHGENRFRNLIKESPIATAIFTGEDFVVELANEEALKLWGKDESVIGKEIIVAMPELEGQPYMDLLKNVYTTGETYYGNENLVSIEMGGRIIPNYVSFIYKALRNSEGEIYGILTMGYNVTEQVEARKRVEYNEERSTLAIDTAMLGMIDLTLPGKKFTCSKRVYEIFGFTDSAPSYEDLFSHVHPDDVHIRDEANILAHITGNVGYEVRIIWPDKTIHWISAYGKFFYDDDKIPTRVLVTIMDITAQKNSLDSSQTSERKFRNVIMQSPIPTAIFRGKDYVIEVANTEMFKNIWRKEEHEVIGKKLFDAFPQLHEPKYQKYPAILSEVFTTGKSYRDNESVAYIHGEDGVKKFYLDCEYSPLQEADGTISGIMLTINDVTGRVMAREKLEVEEARLRLAVEGTKLATWDLDLEKRYIIHSPRLAEIFGYDSSTVLTHHQMRDQIHPDDLNAIVERSFEMALETGFYNYEARIIKPDNTISWIRTQGKVMYNDRSIPKRLIGTLMDITEQRQTELAIRESEQRFKVVADTAPVMIWMSGIDKLFYFFNKGWLDFTGRTLEQEQGNGWAAGVHPDDYQKCLDIYVSCFDARKEFYMEYRLKRYDGQYKWISDKGVPRYSTDGEFIGYIGGCMDIDEQKTFAEKIQKNELLFKTISNASPVGLWMTDVNGQNVFVNDTWINWTGLPLEQHYGHGWLSCVVEEDKGVIPAFEKAFRKREKYIAEFRILRQDNQERWCLTEGYPYFNIHGKFEGYAGSVTDITDIKKLEQQKDFFISMASHELKTPITSIKGYVQILLSMHKDSQDTFLKSSLTTVNKQIGTLTKLIADLLDMSKIKVGSLHLNRENFSLNEMIHETIEEVKHTQPNFDIMFSRGKETIVYADRVRIAQVLINFLTNAIKYSPHFNMVTVKSAVVEKTVVVSVIDSGIGISKNDQEKIFQRFYRVEGRDEKTFPGFGIGLFIAAEIIQRHEGKISVESEPARGSIFSFSLPLEN
ncbi:MAG TPA: PAS domain S-box protein [Ferruginibacter sp.]|nr:PAS domain S-box protein [Ferruginibacter sp.]